MVEKKTKKQNKAKIKKFKKKRINEKNVFRIQNQDSKKPTGVGFKG